MPVTQRSERPDRRAALRLVPFCLFVALGCGPATRALPSPSPIAVVELGLAEDHFHTLPVRVADSVETTFILDTGIGLSLVSRALCERVHCVVDGEFTGRRMSGQAVTLPLARVSAIALGDYVQRDVIVGVVDIPGFFPEPHIEGFLGLPFFAERAFSIDAPGRRLTVESDETLAARERAGTVVPARLDVQGPSIDAFVDVSLASGERASVLVDTGSRIVTLDERYAAGLAIDLDAATDVREGSDETGASYRRVYVTLDAPIVLVAAPTDPRDGLRVMFQEIIHDGLIGTDFMSPFVVTFDVARERTIWRRE